MARDTFPAQSTEFFILMSQLIVNDNAHYYIFAPALADTGYTRILQGYTRPIQEFLRPLQPANPAL